MAVAQHLPRGRHQAGDRHLKFHEDRDNLWDGWTMTLMGDVDLTYHHQVEIRFGGVSYVATPQAFYSPQFRTATQAEAAALHHVIEPDESALVVAWDAEAGSGIGTSFVVAESVEVVEGQVQHVAATDE